MNDRTYSLSLMKLGAIVLVASALGGGIVAVVELAFDHDWNKPPSIPAGESRSVKGINAKEASLLEAVHDAADEAVDFEGGRFKGENFRITSIELTANNPHITAYKVVVKPTG